MSADCRHGLHACPKASACDCSGPRTIPTRPSLLQRLRRAWRRWDLRTRLAGLEALEDELRDELGMLYGRCGGGAEALNERLARCRRIGAQLDDVRGEQLHLRRLLAMLEAA